MTDDRRTEVELERWLADEDPPRGADWVAAYVIDELADTPQERSWWTRSRWVRPVSLLLAAVAAAGLLAVLLQGPRNVGPTTSPTASPSAPSASASPEPSPSRPAEVSEVFTFDEETWSVVPGDGAVWVQVGEVGMARLDPEHGRDHSEPIEDLPNAARSGDSLWAPALGRGVVEMDAVTGETLRTFPGIVGYYIAVDGNSAWVTDVGHRVERVDLATGDRLASIDVPAEPKEVVVGFDSVWTACDAGGVVARIDPVTNEVTAEIAAGSRPVNLAVGEGAVWVWNHDHRLLRIDPATNEVVATIGGMADGPSVGLAVGGGFVWVAVPNGIAKIDPATNTIVDTIELGSGTYIDIEWFDGDLWVSTELRNQVLRITPRL